MFDQVFLCILLHLDNLVLDLSLLIVLKQWLLSLLSIICRLDRDQSLTCVCRLRILALLHPEFEELILIFEFFHLVLNEPDLVVPLLDEVLLSQLQGFLFLDTLFDALHISLQLFNFFVFLPGDLLKLAPIVFFLLQAFPHLQEVAHELLYPACREVFLLLLVVLTYDHNRGPSSTLHGG